MSRQEAREILSQLNLCLDVGLLQEIMQLIEHPQSLGQTGGLDRLSIWAIVGMVCQNKRLLAIDSFTLVSAGLPLERFLPRLPQRSRLPLLRRIEELSLKWRACGDWLRRRVGAVREEYLGFARYRQAFVGLSGVVGVAGELAERQMGVFWLAYLQLRKSELYKKQGQLKYFWTNIIWVVFGSYLYELDKAIIANKLQDILGEISEQIQPNIDREFSDLMMDQLSIVFRMRCDGGIDELKSLMFDLDFVKRFQDDFSNFIEKKYKIVENDMIDEAAFLGLDKNIAPMAIRRRCDEQGVIQGSLSFDDSDEDQHICKNKIKSCKQMIQLPEPIRHQNFELSNVVVPVLVQRQVAIPISREVSIIINHTSFPGVSKSFMGGGRLTTLGWIQRAIASRTAISGTSFPRFFEGFLGDNYGDFRMRQIKILQRLIERYAPRCRESESRAGKCFSLFLFVMQRLMQIKSEAELRQIFSCSRQLCGFVCIVALLFNYGYKSDVPCLWDYLCQFGIGAEEGWMPINWLGVNLQLPATLKEYLFAVERQLLLVQLWRGGSGFQLVECVKTGRATYLQLSIRKRLHKHIEKRVKEMCDGQREAQWVGHVMDSIFSERSIMLRFNSVGTLLVAAYAVAINKGDIESAGQEAVARWRLVDRSFAEELGARDYHGKPVEFEDFLRDIFMLELEILQEDIRKMLVGSAKSEEPKQQEIPSPARLNGGEGRRRYVMGDQMDFLKPNARASGLYRRTQQCNGSSLAMRVVESVCGGAMEEE